MLWFYSRQGEALEVMTHYDNHSDEYVLTLYWADGSQGGRQEEERFTSATEFRARLLEVESLLASDRSAAAGPPKTFAEGWPQKHLG